MRRRLLRIVLALAVLAVLPFLASAVSKMRRPRIARELLERGEAASAPSKEPGYVVRVTWTGVAGVRVESETQLVVPAGSPRVPQPVTTLLFDPYVTRHGFAEFVRPVDSDTQTAARAFPKADAIFVSHAHHDHLADAVGIAERTGAFVYANRTACAFARAMGLRGDRCVVVHPKEHLRIANADVEVVAGAHGRTSRGVLFPGEPEHPPARGLPYVWQLREGGHLNFIVRVNARVLYIQGSAGLTDEQLDQVKDLRPDLALVCLALRQGTPDFEERLLGAMRPRRVAAIHHDDFFATRLSDDFPLLAGVDLPGFEAKTAKILGADALVRLQPFRAMLFRYPTPEQLAKEGWTPPVPYP